MNKSDEVIYLGRIISLLGKHQQLTLGEIKNKTHSFLRKRHQTDSSLFNTLELFVTQGLLRRKVFKSRIYYTLSSVAQGQGPLPEAKELDLIESGIDTGTELFKQMANQALKHAGVNKSVEEVVEEKKKKKEYVPKEPPPTGVEGFK